MKIKYTRQSIADLDAIATFFETQNPSVLPKIQSDIESKIELIKDYPEASYPLKDVQVRKAVTRRYRYVIHFRILYQSDEIQILTVRHFRQARSFKDN
jgi:plasmid stabilization system protein ParE